MNQQKIITTLTESLKANTALVAALDLAFDAGYDQAMEDAAAAIEAFSGPFGQDTVSSFAVLVRGLKA
jgi:hypothetical protein